MNANLKQHLVFGSSQVYFPKRDHKKISRMSGPITVISTVCPDYPNNGEKYTFYGQLGTDISLTAWQHLEHVPAFLEELRQRGIEPRWIILLADLPELTDGQTEFFLRVSDSKEDYLCRCHQSREAIQAQVGDQAQVLTFSEFYGQYGLDYLDLQEKTCELILTKRQEDQKFASKFHSFKQARAPLARLFRGRQISPEELDQAAAHGMSLYATHGTMLRQIFPPDQLIVINHDTANISNFFLWSVVPDGQSVENSTNFPVGILDGVLY